MRVRGQGPSLEGGKAWLNTEPLDLEELRGHVVLVDFWTFTCINWIRTVPHIRRWWDTYRDDGLVVIGVHTPEFSFEQSIDRVRLATSERAIDYPVVADNDYEVWSAFGNHYWPAQYLIDCDGIIWDYHAGEGRYPQSERVIQSLLGVNRDLATVEASGIEAAADWVHLRSPETYLGSARGERRAETPPERLRTNRWTATGAWSTEPEAIVLDRPGGGIAYRFVTRDVHLVLSRRTPDPVPFRVLLDGAAPGPSHGADIDTEGQGVLGNSRLYQLIRQNGRVRTHTLEVTFDAAGVEAYAFTFG